jgi:ABC-type multidrug transport system fused ATPase/permease subunit
MAFPRLNNISFLAITQGTFKSLYMYQERLPCIQVMFDALQTVSTSIGAIALIAVANPTVIPIFLPLAFIFLRIRSYYLHTSREVKRFEAVTRSPVYALFSSTMKGLPTIRAFKAAPRFRDTFLRALNVNGSWWLAYIGTARCVLDTDTIMMDWRLL